MNTTHRSARLCLAIAAAAGLPAAVHAGEPAPDSRMYSLRRDTPMAYAPAVFDMASGAVRVTGAWREYRGTHPRDVQVDLAFDNFESDGPGGAPTDGLYSADCGSGGGRLGVDFSGGDLPDGCAPWVVNDIEKFTDDRYAGMTSTRAQAAYFRYITGPGSSEPSFVGLFTLDDFDDTCEGPAFGSTYPGILFQMSSEDAGAYYADFEVSDDPDELSWTLPNLGGGYLMALLTGSTSDLSFATCSQPALWGTKAANPSQQGPIQWVDGDFTPGTQDGTFTAPTECFDLSLEDPTCLPSIGAAVSFYGDALTPGFCRADCNEDTRATVNDFICFQAEWRTRTAYGDFDRSGTYTVNDFIRFQADWKQFQLGNCVE